MRTLTRETLAWLADHHAVVTADVLCRHGITATTRRRLVREGLLEHLLDGVYRLGGAPPNELDRCVAICARSPEIVIAAPTAGRIWQLRRMGDDGLVHIIGPPHSHPSTVPWLRTYRTALLLPDHVIERPDGIRLTTPARTAVDSMRHLSIADVRSVTDQVLQRGLARLDELHAVAESLATPGRPWARRYLRLLQGRIDGGAPESHWESRVVTELHRRGVAGLETQYPIELPGWGAARLDIAVPRLRWGVEIDGFPDHFTEDGSTRDARRDTAAAALGWLVTRVTTMALRRDFPGEIDLLMAVYYHRRGER